jgi:dolichol kinase
LPHHTLPFSESWYTTDIKDMSLNNIDYNWDSTTEEDLSHVSEMMETKDLKTEQISATSEELSQTRHDLQLARRFFHMGNGFIIASAYLTTLAHQEMIHVLGIMASALYIAEQVRTKYPEISQKFNPITKFIMRAEEQLKESAMMPYAMGILFSIIAFPKFMALIGIYTLALADPMSAIIGIKYGKNRIVPHKSLEGSAAFFSLTFLVCIAMLSISSGGFSLIVFLASVIISTIVSAFEMIPLRIDDNLTIPLFTAVTSWIVCGMLGIPVS